MILKKNPETSAVRAVRASRTWATDKLDPKHAISITNGELFALAGRPLPPDAATLASMPIYLPRVPIDAKEAEAMLTLVTIVPESPDPTSGVRIFAGYTDEELASVTVPAQR